MSRMFEIEWPDFAITIGVALYDEENPELCEKFWQGLPVETIFAASMSAGEMFKVPIPFSLPLVAPDKMLPFPEQPPGTVVVMSGVSSGLLVKYGIVVEPFRLPCIGKIPESELPKLSSVAVRLRDAYFFTKEINMATLKRKE